jgi:hypothetical protein
MILTGADAIAGIGESVRNLDLGDVRFCFESRPGVYGDGDNIITGTFGPGCKSRFVRSGPIEVTLRVHRGRVTDLDARIAGPPEDDRDGAVDLGLVPVPEAVDYLLGLAFDAGADVARDAILPATLGRDAVTWPRLLLLARERSRPSEVRKSAIFWLGQAAGEKVAPELDRLASDDDLEMDLREQAVFAVSQRESEEAVPILIRISRDHSSRDLRKTALFWLAQIDDPRVLPLFEEILTGN